ncbi:TorF family putative porin [Altericroceibacterium spongiae]|nr:TorF family putative porin [Altericroceibacterium spongiae]
MALPCAAQAQVDPGLWVDLVSDQRNRGLSWSDGEAAAQAYVYLPIKGEFSTSAQVTSLRGSTRHGGADAGIDLVGTYADQKDLFRWHGSVVGHIFAGGQGDLDYIEFQTGAGTTLGPVDVDVLVSYAPEQDAIGGSNFYRQIEASAGIWGTPVVLKAHFGRSSGHVEDRLKAERLRPGGAYNDWGLEAEYALKAVTFTVAYTDTDIDKDAIRFPALAEDHGAAIVAGAHFAF